MTTTTDVDRAVSGRRTRHGSQLTVWTGAT